MNLDASSLLAMNESDAFRENIQYVRETNNDLRQRVSNLEQVAQRTEGSICQMQSTIQSLVGPRSYSEVITTGVIPTTASYQQNRVVANKAPQPATTRKVEPLQSLVVTKASNPLRFQNTLFLRDALKKKDPNLVPLISTVKVVASGNILIETQSKETVDLLQTKLAPLVKEIFGEAAGIRPMDEAKIGAKHLVIRNVPAHYSSETILDQAHIEYNSASVAINLTKPGSTASRRPIRLTLEDTSQMERLLAHGLRLG
jgi:hypothetical protein